LKITKNGKLVARRPGKNHFNAKSSSQSQMAGRRSVIFKMKNKDRSKFLPH